MFHTISYDVFEELAAITRDADEKLRRSHTAPDEVKQLQFTCNAKLASRILRLSPSTFSELKDLPQAPEGQLLGNNRRIYSLQDLEAFREILVDKGAMKHPPRRQPGQPCVTFTVTNLKGGVSKTTLATNLASHLALHGYRTLLVDLDPQGSATGILDPNTQLNLTAEDTALNALLDDPSHLARAIRPTAWAPLLDLIPAMPELHFAEWQLIDQPAEGSPFWERLKNALKTVEDRYDAIIIDTHPSLSTLTLSAVWAADWMLIPALASWVDNRAMETFFRNLGIYLKNIEESSGQHKNFAGIRILLSNYKGPRGWEGDTPMNASLEHTIAGIMRRMMGEHMADAILPHSPAFRTAAASMTTIHELPLNDRTNKRALEAFWELGNEVISLLEAYRCHAAQTQEETVA
jgi:chromosome partitioning protein